MGERQFEGILRDNLGEGTCESKIAARQCGVSFCSEASRCRAGLSGQEKIETSAKVLATWDLPKLLSDDFLSL